MGDILISGGSSSGGGGGAVTIADGADVAEGAKADAAWDGVAASATVVSVLKKIASSGTGGGPATIADGADVTQGALADAAVITDTTGTLSGKLRGLVKWAFERMPASLGQKTMANSLPVVVASDQLNISTATGTLQNLNDTLTISSNGKATAIFSQTAGTSTVGIVRFQASQDNSTWEFCYYEKRAAGNFENSTDTPGNVGASYIVNVAGTVSVRAIVTFALDASSTWHVGTSSLPPTFLFADPARYSTQVNGQQITAIQDALSNRINPATSNIQTNGQQLTQLCDNTGATVIKAEDFPSANADLGIPILAVRKSSPANTSGANSDYEMLQISAGRLWTSATIDAALPAGTAEIGNVKNSGTFAVQAALNAETTKVIGTVNQGTSPWVTSVSGVSTAANQTIEIASLASIDTKLTSPLTVAGNKSHNAGAPGATNLGTLPAIATVAAPTYTEGDQVGLSTDLAGQVRISGSISASTSADVQAPGTTANYVSGATGKNLTQTPEGSLRVANENLASFNLLVLAEVLRDIRNELRVLNYQTRIGFEGKLPEIRMFEPIATFDSPAGGTPFIRIDDFLN